MTQDCMQGCQIECGKNYPACHLLPCSLYNSQYFQGKKISKDIFQDGHLNRIILVTLLRHVKLSEAVIGRVQPGSTASLLRGWLRAGVHGGRFNNDANLLVVGE